MKDLQINFVKDGEKVTREFNTLMDFTTYYELSTDKLEKENNITNITAVFFEKPILTKTFDSLTALYEHCRNVMF